jgi:coenzyme F420 hydrogenase subunit beta
VTRIRDLRTVVTSGMCSGCGLCEALAGRERVELRLSPVGHLRPHVKAPLPPELEERILDACPGAVVRGPARRDGIRIDPVWGPIDRLHRSWSADGAVRQRAAAGGTLTALARFLLASGEVDAILHVRANAATPWLTDAVVSRTDADVIAGAQSRYGPAAPLVHVRRLLDDGVRFALVAKPCDVNALRALGRRDPRVARQVPYMLSIFCGAFPSAHFPGQVMRYHGVDPDEVRTFRFRGEGWPGPTRVETRDGRTYDLTYDEIWYDETKPWRHGLQHRCKICPDAIGEDADVAAPDGWLVVDGRPVHREAPGVNFTVCRTPAGSDLVRRAAAAGYLELAPLALDELAHVHADHLPRKTSHPARILALTVLRQPHVRVRGLRPLRALRAAGPRHAVSAFRGALRRARAGTHREPAV